MLSSGASSRQPREAEAGGGAAQGGDARQLQAMQRGNGDGRRQRRRGRRAASLAGEARHGDRARALLLALVVRERV